MLLTWSLPRGMKFVAFAIAMAASISASAATTSEPIAIKTLTKLDKFEPFEAHLFHNGHLWVGSSRSDLSASYRLMVYSSAGELVATETLGHSLRYIYPYTDHSVLIVGMGTDQLSHYTIATLSGTRVQLDAHTIPMEALANRWSGRPGAMIFSDPGGYDDPDHPTPMGQPLQTLFVLEGGEPHWLKPHIAEPEAGIIVGQTLYLLSSPGVGSSARTLHAIDLEQETDTILLDHRNQIVDMIVSPDQSQLIMSESGANQVTIFDIATRTTRSFKVSDGKPRALAAYGKCLLVGIESSKQVQVFDLATATSDQPLATWDLSSAGNTFLQLRDLAADSESGRIYARSAYACTPYTQCADERNSVVMGEPAVDSAARKACL